MHSVIEQVTQRIEERSAEERQRYLARMQKAQHKGPHRGALSCGNLAHGFAG